MTVIAFLFELCGFAALASAMHATPRPLRLRDSSRTRGTAQAFGAVLLCAAFVLLALDESVGRAILDWCGLATLAATTVLLVLAIARPRARTSR